MVKKHKTEEKAEQATATPADAPSGEDGQAMDGEADAAKRLAEKEAAASANYDKYVRAVAELDNYRKRAARERIEAVKYGNEELLRDILPHLDGIDRALQHAEKSEDFESFRQGLVLLRDQLFQALEKHGVQRIETAGRDFDPNFHEAMMQVETEEQDSNKIVEEYEKGYLLNGRLLRPARVSVSKNIGRTKDLSESNQGGR